MKIDEYKLGHPNQPPEDNICVIYSISNFIYGMASRFIRLQL